MFHTFQTNAVAADHAHSRNSPKSRRQSSTTQACEECRRRKIRCDGKKPCSHCEWYKQPKLCRYAKKEPRTVLSQRLVEDLSGSLKQSQGIIGELFPNSDVQTLGNMSRNELVELVMSLPASRPPSSAAISPFRHQSDDFGRFGQRVRSEEAAAPLQALEEEPTADGCWDETKTSTNGVPAIPDDVNALSLSVHRQSSYVGITSVAAALRVISKITTAMEAVITASPPQKSAEPLARPSQFHGNGEMPASATFPLFAPPMTPVIRTPALAPSILINAYFTHVHPMIPMVDEERFRTDAASGLRKDAAWLGLLNMVYAMGTIAASTAEDNSHLHYYQIAKQYLNLDMMGSCSIEAVQALGILGGYYLHYDSKPNMANAIMGAAIRMACALGLHREYSEDGVSGGKGFLDNALRVTREVRRRTWWSLFCLDTWASVATGRPSLGRIGSGVNVALPPPFEEEAETSDAELSTDSVYVMLLNQQVGFCKIATRVQDRLAECPLLPPEETARLDGELQRWYTNIPTVLKWPRPCPATAKIPRAVLSWRYHNLRIMLHRPMLLNDALQSSLEHPKQPSREEQRVVNNCREIGGEAIEDIKNQWEASQIGGWNAVWLLFQASMVPLVTLFAEYNRSNFEAVRDAQIHVKSTIDQLELMQDWSVTAKRSRDVVSKLFERNKMLVFYARGVIEKQQKQAQDEKRKQQEERHEKQRDQPEQHQQQQQQQKPTQQQPLYWHQHHQRQSPQQSLQPRQQTRQRRSHSHTHDPIQIPKSHIHHSQPQQQLQHLQPEVHHRGHSFSTPPHGASIFTCGAFDRPDMRGSQTATNLFHPGSVSPPSTASASASITHTAIFPDGLLPPSMPNGGCLPGIYMGTDLNADSAMADGSMNFGTNYIDEAELNTFWNQIMWGNGDEVKDSVMDTNPDMMLPFGMEQQQGSDSGYGF